MPDKTYITSDGRKFSVKEEAIPEFIASFPGSKPYRDPFWEKASEGYNEAARKDAAMAAMSPKDKAAQVVGEFETIKLKQPYDISKSVSPLGIEMGGQIGKTKREEEVRNKTEEFRRNVLMVRPEDRAEIISSIETKVKDPLLKPELLRIAKSNDYISPGDLELGRENESSTQSDMIESAGLAAEKLGRQGLWNIPKFIVDTRRGHKITKENVDDMSQGFANSFLGYGIPDKDKKEVMREMLGYNQSLSGIIGQGLVDTPAFLTEMATIGLFTGGAGVVPKLTVEGAAKVTRARKIYNGLVKIAESGLESGGKFATAGAAFKGQTDPGEVGHNTLAGFSFHTGEAATQAVAAHSLGKWLMGKQGASARIANNTIKLIGSAASGSIISAGIGGDLSMENIAREAPINVMFAFLTHGSPVGKKKYKEFVIQNGIKEGIIKAEDAPVYEHYLDKWLDKKSINEILVDTKDVLTKVDAAVVAGSKVRMNYDWPLEEVDKNINKSASEKETKDGKEEKDQKEEMLKFSHWGDVPTGRTDPKKIGTGRPGRDQAPAINAKLYYTSAVEKGAPYKEPLVQKGTEYEIEIPKSRVYEYNEEARDSDPFWKAAVEKTGGINADTMIQFQKDVWASGKYDAIKFINESGNYQTRIYTPQNAKQVTRIPDAPDGNFVNVGMKRGIGENVNREITEKEIIDALPKDVKVEVAKVIPGEAENTLSMKLSRELTSKEMDEFSQKTEQQAIPQFSNKEGKMHGEGRMNPDWGSGEFKPEYFKMPDGKSLLDYINEGKKSFDVPSDALALKNESVRANAERIGVSFDEDIKSISHPEQIDKAMETLSKDPLAAEKVREKYLNDTENKTPNTEEEALLLIDWVDRNNNLDALTVEYNRNPTDDNFANIQTEALKVAQEGQMIHDAGTEQGRAFNFRKALLKRDYSLAKILTEKTLAKKAPLNKMEIQKSIEEAAEIKKLTEENLAKESTAIEKELSGKAGELMGDFKAEREKALKIEKREAKIQELVSKRKDILTRLAKGQSLQAGGLSGLKEFGELVGNHIEELAYKGAWKIEDLISRVQKDLKSIGLSVSDNEIKAFYEKDKRVKRGEEGFSPSEVRKLAKKIVLEGRVDKVDELIDEVHNVLKLDQPDITRRETMELMVNYNKKLKPKGELELKARDLLAQDREMLKIEDLKGGIIPPTAYETMDPSDALRALRANVNQLKKTIPMSAVRSDAKIKSALQSLIRRMENSISDLKEEIATGKRKVKGKGDPIQLDEKATKLKEELKSLREEANKIFENDGALARRKKYVQTQIKKINERIQKGDYEKKDFKTKNYKSDSDLVKGEWELAKVKAKYEERLFEYNLARRGAGDRLWDGVTDIIDLSRALKTGIDLSAPLRQGLWLSISHPADAARSIPKMMGAFFSEAKAHEINSSILSKPYYIMARKSGLYLAEHGKTLSQREEAARSKIADKIPILGGSQRAYYTYLNSLRYNAFETMVKTLERKGSSVSLEEGRAIANLVNVVSGRGKGSIGKWNIEGGLDALNRVYFAPRFVLSRFQMALGQPFMQKGATARVNALVAKEYAKYIMGAASMIGLGDLYMKTFGDSDEGVETDPRSGKFGKIYIGNSYLDVLTSLSQTATFLSRLATGETKTMGGDIQALRENTTSEDSDTGNQDFGDVALRFNRTKLSPLAGFLSDLAGFPAPNVPPGHPISEYLDTIKIPFTDDTFYDKAIDNGFTEKEARWVTWGVHFLNSTSTPMNLSQIYDSFRQEGVPLATFLSIMSTLGMAAQTYSDEEKQ